MRRPALLLILLALLHIPAFGQHPDAGTVEFSFMRLLSAARPAGLANSYTVSSSGLSPIGFNPSGIARTPVPYAEGSVRFLALGDEIGQIAYAHSLWTGVVAYGLAYKRTEDIIGVDGDNVETGKTHRPRALVPSVTFAEPLGRRFAWGATLKAVDQTLDIDGSHALGIAADLGAIFHPSTRGLVFGMSLNNLGTKLSGHTENEGDFGNLPLSVSGAASYTPPGLRRTRLILDVQKPIDNFTQVRFGFEQRVARQFEIRGAIRTDLHEMRGMLDEYALGGDAHVDPPSNDLRAALGASFSLGIWTLDYAFQYWSNYEPGHTITIGYAFGRRQPEPSESAD